MLIFVIKAAEETSHYFCLLPNSTHKTQPLNNGMFGLLEDLERAVPFLYTKKTLVKVL